MRRKAVNRCLQHDVNTGSSRVPRAIEENHNSDKGIALLHINYSWAST